MELNQLNDAPISQPVSSAEQEHEKALQALQSEIQFHQESEKNRTYLQRGLAMLHDFSDGSLHDLELAYKAEEEQPNQTTREEVEQLLTADQHSIDQQNQIGNTIANLGAFAGNVIGLKLGSGIGRAISSGLLALNSTNPNDQPKSQFYEALVGGGMGLLASRYFTAGPAVANPWLGGMIRGATFPLAQAIAQGANNEWVEPPNVNAIYETAPETSSPETQFAPTLPPVSTEPLQFPDYLPDTSAIAPLSTPVLASAINDAISTPSIDSVILASAMNSPLVAPQTVLPQP